MQHFFPRQIRDGSFGLQIQIGDLIHGQPGKLGKSDLIPIGLVARLQTGAIYAPCSVRFQVQENRTRSLREDRLMDLQWLIRNGQFSLPDIDLKLQWVPHPKGEFRRVSKRIP